MWLPRFVKSLRWSGAPCAEEGASPSKAVRLLGAARLVDARVTAAHALAGARRCTCCRGMLEHLYERVGSTLFLDDDPEQLAQSLEEGERDGFTARVLAACIVLSGRERVAPAS
ncbi:hypothetical protein LZ198_10265 [Myxococcus sp. K15C18031901]|uniref:hypothetical protein n=1 Tax=Myxococcus dinghuensis TaxID=2906761 RepID=UPI0020A7C64D|nr:hypothetical protein [Myxococcus dinghuensis]MCP3099254.1 hypothetical protein [Myxococcus dinghuensis]